MTDVIRIKAHDDWTLDVLSAPYGGPDNGRDTHGEFFSANTDFYEADGAPLPLVAYYHGYTPDGQPQGEPEIIGRSVKTWRDANGRWDRVVLDKTKNFAGRVWDAAKAGTARASTGVAGFMARTNKTTGEITHWLIGELSIWDAEGDRQPANQYAIASPAVKRLLEDAGFDLGDQDAAQGAKQARVSEPTNEDDALIQDGEHMTEKKTPDELTPAPLTPMPDVAAQVKAQVKAALDADRQERADAEAAQVAEADRTKAAIDAERVKWDAEHAADRRLPGGGTIEAPHVAKFGNLRKYDNLDGADVALMIGILKASNRPVHENALKALAIRATQEENKANMWRTRAALQDMGLDVTKANELNQSTLASYGDEWVGVAYSNQLWEKARLDAEIAAKVPSVEVPQGSESITIPIESDPPTFYKVAQASAQDTNTLGKVTYTVTSSKQGTANQSLTVAKMGARTIFTGELGEDSLIPWMSELTATLTREAAHALDSVILNGDTAAGATANINDIAGTPGGTEYWLIANGFRKLALVTNTANSRSAGALTVEDFLETVKLMGTGGTNAIDQTKVSFILDLFTHWKALELTEVRTRDSFAMPTLENGKLRSLWGYDVLTSPDMHKPSASSTNALLANTSGKIDQDTDGNNTTGAILAVRWDQWRLGFKRRMTIETQRVPQADATDVVLLMRVGLINRDSDASAISYGVTV